MSIALSAVAVAAVQPAAQPAVENEIVVIGQRLRDWRGSWKLEDGAVVCETRRSTGDDAIDAVGCRAMTTCLAPLTAQFVALEEEDLSRRETRERLDALLEIGGVSQCVTRERETGVAALASARRRAS